MSALEDEVIQKLHELKLAQDALDPNIHQHVIQIHGALKEHPEIVALLTDEQVRSYIAARRTLSHISLAPATKVAAKKTAAKKAASMGLDDLG